jgi:hypothetical protein
MRAVLAEILKAALVLVAGTGESLRVEAATPALAYVASFEAA